MVLEFLAIRDFTSVAILQHYLGEVLTFKEDGDIMLPLFKGDKEADFGVVEQMKQALSDANITDYGSAKAVSIVVKTKDGETFPLTQSGSNDNAPSSA